MKVINIWADNNGMIGTVASYEAAIHFLVTKHWIFGTDELSFEYDKTTGEWKSILVQDKLGKDWVNNLLENFDVNSFSEVFNDLIELKETKVYDETFEKNKIQKEN